LNKLLKKNKCKGKMSKYGFKVVRTLVPTDKKDPMKWDIDENRGFETITVHGNRYKVWRGNYTSRENKNIAEVLDSVRSRIIILLRHLENTMDRWKDHPIAFGIYHTLQLHLYEPFEYMELPPNDLGLLGLNKPKYIEVVEIDLGNKVIEYELGTKRVILLTLRNKNRMSSDKQIMDLAIHELTHTTCNDVRWKPDNHLPPYPEYHRFMRQIAKECGII